MPIGSGQQTSKLLPDVPWVLDPQGFINGTSENVEQFTDFADPGPGRKASFDLPDAGIVSRLMINFVGTLVAAGAGGGQTQPTPGIGWPYGLLDEYVCSAVGLAHDLWALPGEDLHVLRFLRYPSFVGLTDQFPGAVGGGGSPLAPATYGLNLTWEVPFSLDEVLFICALFAQSSNATIHNTIKRRDEADLIEPGGTAALWTISGRFSITEHMWEIPIDDKGNMVLPDITRLHTVIGTDQGYTQTGDVKVPLLRTAGQLQRLWLSATSDVGVALSALPGTAAAHSIDAVRLQYGLKAQPYNFEPASVLAAENDQWYGAPLPFDRYAFDWVRRNGAQAPLLQGITNLRAVLNVDPAVNLGVPGATAHAIEEILI